MMREKDAFSPKAPWKTGAPGVACEVLSRFERSGRQGAQLQIPAATDLAGGRRSGGRLWDPKMTEIHGL